MSGGRMCLLLILGTMVLEIAYARLHPTLVRWGLATEPWVDPDEGPDDYKATTWVPPLGSAD